MAEYIRCRECDSPYCKGCNLKNLETMLRNGKFDCIMNENRCINTAVDVAPVVHGEWIEKWGLYDKGFYISRKVWYECSICGMKTHYRDECFEKEVNYNYCPNCGAKMDKPNEPEN